MFFRLCLAGDVNHPRAGRRGFDTQQPGDAFIVVRQRGIIPAVSRMTRNRCRQRNTGDTRIAGVILVDQHVQQFGQMPGLDHRQLQINQTKTDHLALHPIAAQRTVARLPFDDFTRQPRGITPQQHLGHVVQQSGNQYFFGIDVVTQLRQSRAYKAA